MIRLISPGRLHELGIVGMNQRNIGFIGKNNQRKFYPLVDNKLKTKQVALDNGIPVPELYGVINQQSQIVRLAEQLKDRRGFVIKPAQGSGGKGILVVIDRDEDLFVKSSGLKVDASDIRRHATNILAGLYSLGGRNDFAMIEALIDFDPYLKEFSYEGVPDVRVIVYRGVPVMAMIRCATHASDGKANLHQGAVGVGIDIGTGRSICAVQHGHVVHSHPDTGASFTDMQVPHWGQVLELAARCASMTGLGYLGADIVLDSKRGPMLLELNARPGLAIQVANQLGLRHRLTAAEEIVRETDDAAKKIELARERFTVSKPIFAAAAEQPSEQPAAS